MKAISLDPIVNKSERIKKDVKNFRNLKSKLEKYKKMERYEKIRIGNQIWCKVFNHKNELIDIVPSVTTVINYGLEEWEIKYKERLNKYLLEKYGENQLKQNIEFAINRGNIVHKLCEYYLNLSQDLSIKEKINKVLDFSKSNKIIYKYDSDIIVLGIKIFLNYFNKLYYWAMDEINKIYATEYTIYLKDENTNLGFIGTVDAIVKDNFGVHKVIDFKTANHINTLNNAQKSKYTLQICTYYMMIYKKFGILLDRAEIFIAFNNSKYPYQICYPANYSPNAEYDDIYNDIKFYYNTFLKKLKIFYENNKEIFQRIKETYLKK